MPHLSTVRPLLMMGKSQLVLFVTFLLGDVSAQGSPDLTRGCLPGYARLEPGSNCYQFKRKVRNWHDALAWCVKSGTQATLLEIETPEEQSLITTALKERNMNTVWTGGNDIATEGVFEWHNTTIGPYKPWYKPGHNNGYPKEDCIELRKDHNFLWDDRFCTKKNQFVCEHDAAVEVTDAPVEVTYAPVDVTDAPVDVTDVPVDVTDAPVEVTDAPVEVTDAPVEVTECPDGWKDLSQDGNCYLFMRLRLQWFDAVSMCRDFGGHLLEVDSRAEENRITNQLRFRGITGSWLGASDILEEGVWRWHSDGRRITGSKPWYSSSPSHNGSFEHCLAIQEVDSYGWNDIDCYSRLKFICKKRLTSAKRGRRRKTPPRLYQRKRMSWRYAMQYNGDESHK